MVHRPQSALSPASGGPRADLSVMALVGWTIGLIVLFTFAQTTDSWLLTWLAYLLGALLLLAAWVTLRPARLTGVNRRLATSNVTRGEVVPVQVCFGLEGSLAPGWILAEETLPPGLEAFDPTGRLFVTFSEFENAFTYRVRGNARGLYPLGPITVTTGDLFGLASRPFRGDERQFITIVPSVHPVPDLMLPSNRPCGDARSMKRLYEDPTRLAGVREYLPGDPLSRIHWKSSAHQGALATKICEPSSMTEINVVLNLFAGDFPTRDAIELACTTAASLAARLIESRALVGLMSNASDAAWAYETTPRTLFPPMHLKADKGNTQLAPLLSLLGRAVPSTRYPLGSYLTQIHASLPWTATMLLITHALTPEATLALDTLRRGGFEVAVVIVGTGPAAEEALLRAATQGMPAARVEQEDHLGVLAFMHTGRA